MDSNTIIMLLIVAAVVVVAFVMLRGRSAGGEAAPAEAPAAPAPVPAAPAAPAMQAVVRPAHHDAPAAPQIEEGIPPEVVAAIAAAVSAIGSGRYTLRAVRRADRSAWARAGAIDATAPF